MNYDAAHALRLLRAGTEQPAAVFRDGQEDAIRHVVEGRGRLLVVQKTGWGKSFVYFIATRLLRSAGGGPALLVSPLLSLMRNQLAAAQRMGLCAETIHSDNQADWDAIEARLAANNVDILLISPERLANERFVSNVLAHVAGRLSLLVVDEAHCISDWGHDFRPHYRRLERIISTLPQNLRVLATTATANDRVMDDLQAVLGPNLTVSRGDLHRPSVTLQTIQLPDQAQRLAWLAQYLPQLNGSGIVYTLTVRDAQMVSSWLQARGIVAPAYTGQSERREELEQALVANQVKALVATTALGMGFDKPDLAFVVHYQCPGSVVAYYQQVGRAGRALPSAYGVLLSGKEEMDIGAFFIDSAFPTRDEVQQILDALQGSTAGLSVPELTTQVNVSHARIKKALELLSLESPAPVARQGSKWHLTAAPLAPSFWERAERLTLLRKGEQAQMQEYVRLESGHMQFLINALDGDSSGVGQPGLPPLPTTVDPQLVQEAVNFLGRISLPIQPRKRWADGGLPSYGVKGNIPSALQAQPGKALCVWGDAGWGAWVKQGKYGQDRFDDRLVTACVDLLRNWAPDPAPTWVTCVPSLRRPKLVPDFAARLAQTLGLQFAPVIVKTEARPAQKKMANSAQQARNVDGSLAICPQFEDRIPNEPVLLVDDMVDSRWTLTIALGSCSRTLPVRFGLSPSPKLEAEMTDPLSPNTQAILLLTAPLIVGRAAGAERPLTPAQYAQLAVHLRNIGRQPADFLAEGADELLQECASIVDVERMRRLLARGFLLSQAIERWSSRAIWVMSRADPTYPRRLKKRLGVAAPAVLYGCGEAGLLDAGGLAVVGSRRVDDALVAYTEAVGRLAADSRRAIVSGGARGVDEASMRGSITNGGTAIGILADSLAKAALKPDYRDGLRERRLVLVSPYDPSAGFNVGHAMQRNKLIYALADAALVVNSDVNKGGTWAGAKEQLDKLDFVTVYVRQAGQRSPGLEALRRAGAELWPEPQGPDEFAAALAQAAAPERTPSPPQLTLSTPPPTDRAVNS